MARKTQAEQDEYDLDKFLRLESNAFSQDREVDRIFTVQHSQDPFVILDMSPMLYITCSVDDREIKLQYRKRSLLVHPDKCKHPRAQEAFEILKKTSEICMNPSKRRLVFEYIREARAQVFHEKKIKEPMDEEPVNLYSDAPKDKFDVHELIKKFPNLGKEIQ